MFLGTDVVSQQDCAVAIKMEKFWIPWSSKPDTLD